MAKRNTSTDQPVETVEQPDTIETSLEGPTQEIKEPKAEETPTAEQQVKGTDPVHVELKTPETTSLSPAASPESIQASMQEKLSRKNDEGSEDPFVPNTQLQNEVKEVAKNSGFPLSRGTEVGARLMARAKRIS